MLAHAMPDACIIGARFVVRKSEDAMEKKSSFDVIGRARIEGSRRQTVRGER